MLKNLLYIILITLGIFMFTYAEVDDSPGGQLLGVIIAGFGAYKILKNIYENKKEQ